MQALGNFLSRTWRDAVFLVALIAIYFLFGFFILPRLGIST